MSQEKIKDFLLTVFNEDYIRNNKEYSYISQLIVITIKSLIPSRNISGSIVDYERYEKEMKLWYYYRNGENKPIINSITTLDNIIYWDEIDDTAYTRVIPIILANDKWEVMEEQVIKNILYTTGKISTLFEGLLLSRILYLLMENKNDNIIESLKEEIINFSQTDFIKRYSKYYRVSTEKYPGNFTVDFEKNKINVINMLNSLQRGNFPIAEEVIFNKESGKSIYWKAIESITNYDNSKEYKDYQYDDMCSYLYKLKKGYINPESLIIREYHLPDIFSFNLGDEFFHTLLNKSKIIDKKESKENIEVYVETKSGIYRFHKNKRPSI